VLGLANEDADGDVVTDVFGSPVFLTADAKFLNSFDLKIKINFKIDNCITSW
jgi:hypothetical protein